MHPSLSLLAEDAPEGAWAREHLASDVVGWLTTVTPDGQPQTSVICFLWDGQTLLIYSKPRAPKVRNIAANPRVAFNLQSDPYGDHMLSLEGRAEFDESLPPQDQVAAYMAKYREPLAHWGMDPGATGREFSLAIRVRPTRVRVF